MRLLYRFSLVRRLFYPLRPALADVAELWDFLTARCKFFIVTEKNPKGLQMARDYLACMGVQAPTDFLIRFPLPLVKGPFRGIYLPFRPGAESPGWSPWRQIQAAGYALSTLASLSVDCNRYYESTSTRAYVEWLACRTQHELEWRYQGRLPSPARTADRLLDYGCDMCGMELCRDRLRDAAQVIKDGGMASSAAQEVSKWVDERYGLYAEEVR